MLQLLHFSHHSSDPTHLPWDSCPQSPRQFSLPPANLSSAPSRRVPPSYSCAPATPPHPLARSTSRPPFPWPPIRPPWRPRARRPTYPPRPRPPHCPHRPI